MTTLYALEQRVRALEARLADVEGGYGQTIYKLHRHAIRTDLALGRISITWASRRPTDQEVDAARDEA